MKIYKLNPKSCSGSALLFSIMTAFVLSFTSATMVLLMGNQYKIINDEIESIKTDYLLKAGMEYAYNKLRKGEVTSLPQTYTLSLPEGCPSVDVTIDTDTTGTSDYTIEVSIIS